MDEMTSTITAIPAGRDRHGKPLARRYYWLTRAPEPFDEGKSRLWGKCAASARHGLDRQAPLAVVWTDSIEQVAS